MRNFTVLIGVSLGLAISTPAYAGSCLTASPRKLVDPFVGIIDRQLLGPANAAGIGNPRNLNAAIILSQNTKDQLAWSKKAMSITGLDRATTTFFLGPQLVANADRMCQLAYDPKFITDSVMQPIVRRFREVKVIGDVSEFAHGPYDLLILIDVSFVDVFRTGVSFGIGAKFETGTNINIYFIDKTYALAGKIEAARKQRVPAKAFTNWRDLYLKEVATLRGETLAQYQAGIQNLLGPDPTIAPTAAQAAPVSAADRLKTVEDLLREGLITPEEAAQKKAEILQSL